MTSVTWRRVLTLIWAPLFAFLATARSCTAPEIGPPRRPGRRRTAGTLSVAASVALVGVALTGPAATAATATPIAPTDIGTLPGGSQADANAVSGAVVVGKSENAGGWGQHAFAYNLGTGEWKDLGTFGGPASEANDVDGDTVVGSAYTTPTPNTLSSTTSARPPRS